MQHYIVLIRGINVGGKNPIPMAALRAYLEELGYRDVQTYIASGNVIVRSEKAASSIKEEIESTLPKRFKVDDDLIRVLVLSAKQLREVVARKPAEFGDKPNLYHSDVIFLIGIDAKKAMAVFNPKEGVDTIWPGRGVVYSQRLSAKRTQSRLNRIMVSPLYKSMTIRNWNTVTKLLALTK